MIRSYKAQVVAGLRSQSKTVEFALAQGEVDSLTPFAPMGPNKALERAELQVLVGKIPYNIQMSDGRPFVSAGLWEGWKPPGSEGWIGTCTIIAGEPNELMRELHTRMPVILAEDKLDAWLSGKAGKEMLREAVSP